MNEARFDRLREDMVRTQIAARGITEPRVLKAMREVRRHEFVDAALARDAYADGPLPIGQGQTISQPYIVAWMSQLLEVGPDMDVLEVGTGCGYQTAVLAKLARHVYSMERIGPLSRQAAINLQRAGIDNVTLTVGDGYEGWAEFAPFLRILAAAAPGEIPPALLDQLASGGVLVAPTGARSLQEMVRIRKGADGTPQRESLGAVSFVPLVKGEHRENPTQ
jgi:protein-L-isoaspartate(D-aspartate) O-methyltransferase